MDEGDLSMKMCDVVLVGYAVNSTSGGYTNRDVKYVDTVGIKYLYSHFYGTYCAEPVAFLQLAAQMRAVGIDTYILDGLLLGYSRNEMEQYLKKIKTDIYCFSLYESSKADILYLMHYVKKINPNAIIITGGPYVTLCYRELIEQEKVIDYIVIGDGDFAMRDLVTALLYKKSHHNIPNVVYRDKNGQVAMDVCPEAVDMDELIAPSRDFVDIIKQKGFSLSLASSRGCGHGVCSFCYLNQYQKNSNQPMFRFRSPELLIADIKELIEKYEITKLTFVDDDFFGPNSYGVKRAKHFFELLIENNIRLELYINVRIASVLYLISQNLLQLVADAGVKYIFVGIESYNDDILRRYKKGITTQDIDMVCTKLEEYGIYINPGMITFDSSILPYQVKNNIDLLKRIHYYDLFMFTRTLMDLPSDKHAKKNNQITSNFFENKKTEKLYYSLVEFRDLLYPLYAEIDRKLITEQIRNKIVEAHFDYFYELYDLYGEDNSIWDSYINKKIDNTSTSRTSDNSSKSNFSLGNILDMAKNIDANRLSDGISSLQKAIGLFGDIISKDSTSSTNSSYTPRPIYRKFDD